MPPKNSVEVEAAFAAGMKQKSDEYHEQGKKLYKEI